MKRVLNIAAAICFISINIANAQFAVPGDNPASVRWYQIETDYYKIIYPKGLDSLARIYGRDLEGYRIPVGRTAGYAPGTMTRTKTPVVLFAFNAQSNGLVSWAPKRMELYTTPSADDAEAAAWHRHLVIHESRHVAQMQGGLSDLFRPMKYVVGEMFNGFVAGLYPRIEMLEGDAVVAETALTRSGRGRSADFMNYYMIAFDNGDFRNWEKWRFGSQRNYYLNQYAAGYLMTGGVRYVYGYPDVVGDFYRHIGRRPYDLGGFDTVVRKRTGKKMKEVYREIADTLNATWQKDMEARRPYIAASAVSEEPSRYTEYTSTDFIGKSMYSVKSGMVHCPELVRTGTDGKEHRIGAFAYGTSQLRHCRENNCIFWSEPVSDVRWGQKVNSLIRYKRLPRGRKRSLTHKGRMYNPFPHGKYLSATGYTDDGRSRLVVLDSRKGRILASKVAPDSLQIVESAWADNGVIYVTGISESGYGLYSVHCDEESLAVTDLDMLLPPQPVKVTSIDIAGDMVTFTSDRTGVNEFYHFDPLSREVYQITSTRYGAQDFTYNETADTLYFSAAEYEGKVLRKTPVGELMHRKVDFSDIYRYAMADELSRQEQELAAADTTQGPHVTGEVSFSEPQRYRKGAHLFNIHSWAPFYFDVDNIMAFSEDITYEMISLGAAAISQNQLGTAVSRFGYSAHKDPYNRSNWRHSGHFKFTYSGWYPVIELSVDFNDRGARNYFPTVNIMDMKPVTAGIYSRDNGTPSVSALVSTYIPFNFSSGGWSRGLVPRLSYRFTNDIFNVGPTYKYSYSSAYLEDILRDKPNPLIMISESLAGKRKYSQTISGSLRFYTMRPVPNSAVYPRLGFGIEVGASQNLGMAEYISPMGYAYVYGYVPGFIRQHGIRLSAMYQQYLDKDKIFTSTIVNTLPRGLSDNAALRNSLGNLSQSVKLTVDYAMPIYSGDLAIWGTFMYIKRFVLTPHFDYTLFKGGDLFSAGATFAIDFRSILWLEFPVSLGITCSYNGGRSFNAIRQSSIPIGRCFVGPVFDISF